MYEEGAATRHNPAPRPAPSSGRFRAGITVTGCDVSRPATDGRGAATVLPWRRGAREAVVSPRAGQRRVRFDERGGEVDMISSAAGQLHAAVTVFVDWRCPLTGRCKSHWTPPTARKRATDQRVGAA